MTTQVDFWFDPTCPWAWMTSRWILEVEKVRDVKAVFHPMSLFILNEGRDLDPGYRAHIDETLIASRAAAAVMKLYGHDQVRDFYTALGTRLHPKGEPITVETIAAALQEAGLDTGIAQRVTTDEFDADLLGLVDAHPRLGGDAGAAMRLPNSGPPLNRSRCGNGPISSRNTTDLGGSARLLSFAGRRG
mgnify:CR=1 FL=1